MTETTEKKIVPKIEEDMNPRDVLCTTYQMRNPFRQFFDGVITELDVHCYMQHAFAADMMPKKNGKVMDVCCGRGLMIPFLRYRNRMPSLYVGVDIHKTNAVWREGERKDPRRPKDIKDDWGFERVFVESNVATMTDPVRKKLGGTLGNGFDLVIYTSAIEHMQPSDQQKSLKCAYDLTRKGGQLYLTCPVSRDDKSGYDTQYKAHVYEPTMGELKQWLAAAGWKIQRQIGLCSKVSSFRKILKGADLRGAEYIMSIMPRQQALPTIGALYIKAADEMALVCVKE